MRRIHLHNKHFQHPGMGRYDPPRKIFGSPLRSRRAFWSTLLSIATLIALLYYVSPSGRIFGDLANDIFESHTPHPLVRVKNGSYSGVHNEGDKMDYFHGIRYAQPPIGELRYKGPQSLTETWSSVKPAHKEASKCIGFEPKNDKKPGHEDCLFLNVARPTGYAPEEKLPVLIYIHGGSFIAGSANEGVFQPATLVNNGVEVGKPFIFVSIQYRLSVFGFLYSQEIVNESAGNIGIRDQRKALHWVKENIEAFGGDPNKITIWGSSAGSISVGWHLLAFGGRDDHLFRGAIMSSGSPQNYETFRNLTFYNAKYARLLEEVGCKSSKKSLQCLRGVDATRIVEAHKRMDLMTWKPAIDGEVLTEQPSKLLESGRFTRVPVIAGVNTDEGLTWLFPEFKKMQTEDELRKYLMNPTRENPRIGATLEVADRMLAAYPDDPCLGLPEVLHCQRVAKPGLGAQWQRFGALITDLEFQAPRRHLCRALARAGVPIYSYRYNANALTRKVDDGVLHSDEKGYFWNHTEMLQVNDMPTSFYKMMRLMSSSIAAFVTDLDPNTYQGRDSATEKWHAYTIKEPTTFVFNASKTDARVTSGVEQDTFRLNGIDVLISLFNVFNR